MNDNKSVDSNDKKKIVVTEKLSHLFDGYEQK